MRGPIKGQYQINKKMHNNIKEKNNCKDISVEPQIKNIDLEVFIICPIFKGKNSALVTMTQHFIHHTCISFCIRFCGKHINGKVIYNWQSIIPNECVTNENSVSAVRSLFTAAVSFIPSPQSVGDTIK